MKKKIQLIKIKTPEKGILNLTKIKSIKREGKSNIFCHKLKRNVTKYLYDFFYYKELLNISSTNIFLHNCLSEYEMSSWDIELRNIIDIFNLDIKNIKEEVGVTLESCIEKNHLYKMINFEGNYVKINNEGINIISSVYYDPDMKLQLNKLNNNIINNDINININNSFDSFQSLEDDEETNKINPFTLKTPWKVIHCNSSYNQNNIIFLEEKSSLNFGFSFHNVIKGNYKLFLHQSIINMKNAKLILRITINNILVYETKDFPNKEILDQFNNNNFPNNIFDDMMSEDEDEIDMNQEINLKETYICDIKEEMFDKVKENFKKLYESKNTCESLGSTESTSSKNNNNNSYDANINGRINKYKIRVSFVNQHLFWKAGWYLDGGKLVKDKEKI